ncbi:hypothetical protein FQR65_LT17564 [Abscondita terminalis]|nr:hypothetical protein FQR65_LT17564 [Abscondita terminalis]
MKAWIRITGNMSRDDVVGVPARTDTYAKEYHEALNGMVEVRMATSYPQDRKPVVFCLDRSGQPESSEN